MSVLTESIEERNADLCIEALKDALRKYGTPAIFNTDQGSQFTSNGFIQILKEAGVEISMDGQGRWRDNISDEAHSPCYM